MVKVAVLVIDMLNDFVKGALKCERANRIIPNIKKLLDKAHEKGVPCIYTNDAHLPNVDKEFDIWGPHAVVGTEGAKVIEELKPKPEDYVIPKRRYSGFYQTDLDLLLRELKVDTLILTGLHTNCCVKHTACDAYLRGYRVIVPEDCVDAFTQQDHEWGLNYMKTFYKAVVTNLKEALDILEKYEA